MKKVRLRFMKTVMTMTMTADRPLCLDKKSARDMLADEENFLWNNLDKFAGDK